MASSGCPGIEVGRTARFYGYRISIAEQLYNTKLIKECEKKIVSEAKLLEARKIPGSPPNRN